MDKNTERKLKKFIKENSSLSDKLSYFKWKIRYKNQNKYERYFNELSVIFFKRLVKDLDDREATEWINQVQQWEIDTYNDIVECIKKAHEYKLFSLKSLDFFEEFLDLFTIISKEFN